MPAEARPDASALREARERVIQQLSEAFSRDELAMEEFDRRLSAAHRAESDSELSALVSDVARAPAEAEPLVKVEPPRALAELPPRAEDLALSVMGTVARRGEWAPPRQLRAIAVMGNVELDFREATMPAGVTDLEAFAFMGSVRILVPPTLAVDMTGGAIMGSFEHTHRTPMTPDPDRPVLRVHGTAIMGSVDIVTRLPGETGFEAFWRRRRERKALRERYASPALPPRTGGDER
jgi:hypothetical protein